MWKPITSIDNLQVGVLAKTKDGEIILIGNCSDVFKIHEKEYYTYFGGCGCCADEYYVVEYDDSLVEIIQKKLESLS